LYDSIVKAVTVALNRPAWVGGFVNAKKKLKVECTDEYEEFVYFFLPCIAHVVVVLFSQLVAFRPGVAIPGHPIPMGVATAPGYLAELAKKEF
jgi:hypothetical protein